MLPFGVQLKERHRTFGHPYRKHRNSPYAVEGTNHGEHVPQFIMAVGENVALSRLSFFRCQQTAFGYIPHIHKIISAADAGRQLSIEVIPNHLYQMISTGVIGAQNSGRMDRYVEAEKKVARELHIPVADAYAVWKQMASEGVDTTAMLANGMNHPTPEAHHIFLDVLTKVIFDEGGDR